MTEKEFTLDTIMNEFEKRFGLSKLNERFDTLENRFDNLAADMKELKNRVQANEDEMLLRSRGPYGATPLARTDLYHDRDERGYDSGFGGRRGDYLSHFDHG